jgi:hypothetical protein
MILIYKVSKEPLLLCLVVIKGRQSFICLQFLYFTKREALILILNNSFLIVTVKVLVRTHKNEISIYLTYLSKIKI